MFVSERNIFDYIFYPNKLNNNLKGYISKNENFFGYISKNENFFESEIKFYKSVNKNLKSVVSYEERIIDLIIGNNSGKTIDLKRLKPKQKKTANVFSLDSSNTKLEKSIVTETFIDDDSQYLVKVVITNNLTKIYVFNKNNTFLENFKLTLFPDRKSFNFENNQFPLILDGEHAIDNVKLELN